MVNRVKRIRDVIPNLENGFFDKPKVDTIGDDFCSDFIRLCKDIKIKEDAIPGRKYLSVISA